MANPEMMVVWGHRESQLLNRNGGSEAGLALREEWWGLRGSAGVLLQGSRSEPVRGGSQGNLPQREE